MSDVLRTLEEEEPAWNSTGRAAGVLRTGGRSRRTGSSKALVAGRRALFLSCIQGVFLVLTCSQRRMSRSREEQRQPSRGQRARTPTPAALAQTQVDIPPQPGAKALPALLLLVQTCPGGDVPLWPSRLIRPACLGPGWGSTRPGTQGLTSSSLGAPLLLTFPAPACPGVWSSSWKGQDRDLPSVLRLPGELWRPATQAEGLTPWAVPQLVRRRRLPMIPSSP